jgi:hypothetical protein
VIKTSVLRVRGILALFLMFFNICVFGQIINPWTNTQVKISNNCKIVDNGIFQGLNAKYGVYAHKGHGHRYKALPFLFLPSEKKDAPNLIILNGGPGVSNLRAPEGVDSLLNYFNILIPGYRGVDDCLIDSYEELDKKQNSHTISLISKDISNIAAALKFESVYVAAHSFGSIYACNYLLMEDGVDKKSIFVSPIMTQDIATVLNKMEQMVEKYFSNYRNGSEKYNNVLTEIENSSDPEQLSMALVIFLSEFQNCYKIDSILESKGSIVGLLQNTHNSYKYTINAIEKQDKLSSYFNFNDTTGFSNLGKLGKLLLKYFVNEVQPNTSPFHMFKYCTPDTTISAYYDYSVCFNDKVIENTGHSDIWSKAWRYIIDFYNNQ